MQLLSVLNTLDVGDTIASGPLAVFPLLRADAPAAACALLDDALDAGLAEVTEISDGGSVPEPLFRNKSVRDILLVDGEELIGAKQNRVLNLTILVGAWQEVTIPVSCVESGRWAWRSRRFASGRKKLNARARLEKMRGVSASLRESGARFRGDIQAEVGRSVDDSMSRFAVSSDSSALHEVYEAVEDRLRAHRARIEPLPGQTGAAFVICGQVAGVELFDAADTLAKLLPKLVDSYLLDALAAEDAAPVEQVPTLEEVRALLARIADSQPAVYTAVAKGVDLRIEQPGLHAAALADGERVVHLSAFEGGRRGLKP